MIQRTREKFGSDAAVNSDFCHTLTVPCTVFIYLQSEKLIESAYAMDWLEIPIKYKRAIIIFMERIKRTINLVSGSLIPLSNATFVSVSQ